jgi:hypothetical protein
VPHTGPLCRLLRQSGEQTHLGRPRRITHFLPSPHSTPLHDSATHNSTSVVNGRQTNSEENVDTQPREEKHRAPTAKNRGPNITLQEDGTDQAWPNP